MSTIRFCLGGDKERLSFHNFLHFPSVYDDDVASLDPLRIAACVERCCTTFNYRVAPKWHDWLLNGNALHLVHSPQQSRFRQRRFSTLHTYVVCIPFPSSSPFSLDNREKYLPHQ
ncbi:uncharacterized protein AKAW2_10321A [Aspergillus luchuensis]|uniref:Uncharacterized protein n=1 Tax=Aspergillus kawachii TaxID=1069201 RepID=A0A7R7WNI4_ASPKA|nr:uncharacterized protein AKAW2_10321A [Aspergillus luchuensis]BCR93275.1 hypothetical protein AKAW2_10321A [Aspergillus luchuensis]BCS05925.1 hypothetical protein ALUC_10306A [Aspergillus luchuensis]